MSAIDHPRHYRSHASGVECIDIAERLSFNLGNAVKYAWRSEMKGQEAEDLAKCAWYCDREAARLDNLPPKWLRLLSRLWNEAPEWVVVNPNQVRAVLNAEQSNTPLRMLMNLLLCSEIDTLALRTIALKAREASEELAHEEALTRADRVLESLDGEQ